VKDEGSEGEGGGRERGVSRGRGRGHHITVICSSKNVGDDDDD
jgi:hypothetical protein